MVTASLTTQRSNPALVMTPLGARHVSIAHRRPASIRRWLGTAVHAYVALSALAATPDRHAPDEKDATLSAELDTFDMEEYKRIFDQLDKNGDGIIDVDELTDLLKTLNHKSISPNDGQERRQTQAQKAIEIANRVKCPQDETDPNLDAEAPLDGISFRDFLWLMAHRDRALKDAEQNDTSDGRVDLAVRQAFHALDIDRDGKVSSKDVLHVLKALGETLEGEEGWSKSEVERLLKQSSADGKNEVTLEEFARVLRSV